MTPAQWLAFLCLALAASFSPGPGVLLAISTTLTLGARRTVYGSAGNAVGVFLVSCLAVGGVGWLGQRTPLALAALKLGGAAYLAWLGVRQWRAAGQGLAAARDGAAAAEHGSRAAAAEHGSRAAVFRRGLLVACSNPKAFLFWAAVLPQFLPPGRAEVRGFLLLSLTFVACTLVSHLAYALLAGSVGTRLLAGRGMARLQRGTGLLFMVLALGMVTGP